MENYQGDNYDPEETAGLLSGPGPEQRQTRKNFALVFLGAVLISLITVGITVTWTELAHELPVTPAKRNVILMISDGFGPASETFARDYYQFFNDLPYDYVTPLDEILVGSSRTRSSSSLVTDSAAGATAFSCVMKTYNGGIGVDPQGSPCGTILEAAKELGMATGLVVTSRITHATPASFSAHVVSRDLEYVIATQQIGDYPLGRRVDLMFGGGRCYFLPNSTEDSCRPDTRDVLSEAKKVGFHYLSTREEFDKLENTSHSIPLLGLFTLDHMSYEIDRDATKEPSLKEMSVKAIEILESQTADSENGFFLMIEGSRIDMAGHSNDPGTHVHEILAYHQTIEAVRKYVDNHPGTVMISVSDHETGGLSLARQINSSYPQYLWYPDVITRIKNSSYALAVQLENYWKKDRLKFINETILRGSLGIDDFTNEEVTFLNENQTIQDYEYYLANLTSWRAQLGWATHGHSAVDVNLYARGMNTELLHGNHENTYIGEFIKDYLDLDLDNLTLRLNSNNPSFHLSDPSITNFNADHLAHYHH